MWCQRLRLPNERGRNCEALWEKDFKFQAFQAPTTNYNRCRDAQPEHTPICVEKMSFRKRNIPLNISSRGSSSVEAQAILPKDDSESKSKAPTANFPPGVRPSPIDGRPTTSTGTASLDNLLTGHAGFALGNSLLIEEHGTTDYAGSLLRFYAAEGVVQGHQVHVVGMRENWGRGLPGIVGATGDKQEAAILTKGAKDKMKIAWRYEGLGEIGEGSNARGVPIAQCMLCYQTDFVVGTGRAHTEPVVSAFCHTYDLTKRLDLPSPTALTYISISASSTGSPFHNIIEALTRELMHSAPGSIHRIVIPTLLSPALYPHTASHPTMVLQFLHALRALLRRYVSRATALISLPLSLFPRSMGLTRWIELLCDGVIELVPFPHTVDAGPALSTTGTAISQEEVPQGMVRLHRLPVFHERGGGATGAAGVGDDLAFTLSRKRFVIKPFSLPPVDNSESQQEEAQRGKTKVDIDF